MKKYYNKSKNNSSKELYYVVHKGHKPGIYSTWLECKKQVDNFEGAQFKKFTNEKEAIEFLQNGFGKTKEKKKPEFNDKQKENIDNKSIDAIYIYTDGSCIKMKNSIVVAGFGIYIPSKNISVASPLLNQKLTNNRAELRGIIDSVKYLDEEDLTKKINIVTDSQYCMYLFHGTGERYEKAGFKSECKDVPNIDLIKELLNVKRNYNTNLIKIRAHTGKKDIHSLNNEIADKLANEGALSTIEQNSKNSVFGEFEKKIKSLKIEDLDGGFFKNNKNNNEKINELDLDDDVHFKKFLNIKEKINKDIQMNELFEFGQLSDDETPKLDNKLKKTKKSLKLSNWFIPK
jgi:ribonuclease HI